MMSRHLNVIGVGEVLWDMLPEGKKLGGAPCNFVYHCIQQVANGTIISAVGNDQNGKEILELLDSKGLPEDLIQVNDHPTGTVDVSLSDKGIPEYTIHENVSWDFISYSENTQQMVLEADIICFGTLAQRADVSRITIEKILKACKPGALVVCDINLRQHYYSHEIIQNSLELCNVLKVNEEELPVICEVLKITEEEDEDRVFQLMEKFNLKLVALTMGTNGSLLLTPTGRSYLPTPQVKVRDTVGAGDSFTAVMSLGLANGSRLEEFHKKAVEVSAFVCTQDGAMPVFD
jgi:fructokinase